MTDSDDPLDDALAGWEPETRIDSPTARSQTRRVAEYLRNHGDAHRKQELQDTLVPGSALEQREWWHHAVWPGLNHLADHGLVERTENNGYRWVGPDHNSQNTSSP